MATSRFNAKKLVEFDRLHDILEDLNGFIVDNFDDLTTDEFVTLSQCFCDIRTVEETFFSREVMGHTN